MKKLTRISAAVLSACLLPAMAAQISAEEEEPALLTTTMPLIMPAPTADDAEPDILIAPVIAPAPDAVARFTDIPADCAYTDGIRYCVENGLFLGTSETEFSPELETSRAMVTTVLWRMEDCPYANYYMTFGDVADEEWYTEAVRWAAAEKIVNGYSAEAFGPHDAITREQLAMLLYNRFLAKGQGFVGSWMFLLPCEDRAEISDWAYAAVCFCTMKGLLSDTDGYFRPQDHVSRAELAGVIAALAQYEAEQAEEALDTEDVLDWSAQ